MAVTFNVRCPVCGKSLIFKTDSAEFWGMIPVTDVGCVEVTRPWSPEVEEHLNEHRADGTHVEALKKHYQTAAANAAAFNERFGG